MNKRVKTPSESLLRIDAKIFMVSRIISYTVCGAILIIMTLAFCDVIAAKFFSTIIPSATEWITYLNVLAVFPAVAFVQLDRGHTNVDLTNLFLPQSVIKSIRIFGHILGCIISALIAWRGFILCASQFSNHEMSSASALAKGVFPVWPFSFFMSAGCLLLSLAYIWCLVREFTGLPLYSPPPKPQTGPDAPDPANTGEAGANSNLRSER